MSSHPPSVTKKRHNMVSPPEPSTEQRYKQWLLQDIGPIIKPYLTKALQKQPAKFAQWLRLELGTPGATHECDLASPSERVPHAEYMEDQVGPVIRQVITHMCLETRKRGRRRQTDNVQMLLKSLQSQFMRPREEEKEEENDAARGPPQSSVAIRVGDIVSAKSPGECLFFEGVLVHVNGDGTFDVDFGDEVVACRDIRKVKDWHALELGDEVKVKESDGCLSFVARITAINFETETYTVEYDGGEMEENVDEARVQKTLSYRLSDAARRWNMLKNSVKISQYFMHGLSVSPDEEEAATKVQSIHRQKAAKNKVQGVKEDNAATKLQSKHRQTLARNKVQGVKEDKAATVMQAKQRQRQAKQKVEELKVSS